MAKKPVTPKKTTKAVKPRAAAEPMKKTTSKKAPVKKAAPPAIKTSAAAAPSAPIGPAAPRRIPTSAEIRAQFLEFFEEQRHTIVPSDAVDPGGR